MLLALAAWSMSVYAHQQKESYTSVLFNPRSELVEVSHRFSVHDAGHVMKVLLKLSGDLTTDVNSQEQFADYIKENFSIKDGDDNPYELKTVGHEVDLKHFWVYQEMPIPELEYLHVTHTALFEVLPQQINYINIEKDGWVRSARLTQENSSKKISLLE